VLPLGSVTRRDAPSARPVAAAELAVGQPRFIDLSIKGEDLLLSGKFEHWVPMSLESGGKQNEAQLLVDVTSHGPADDADAIFSFESKVVRRISAEAFLAKGTLRRGDVQRATEVVVQIPPTHSPFAAVTVHLDEPVFPEVWSELSARFATQGGAESEVRPRAWLLTPVVAAA
jgi:hypothetical protein